ncbi:MAG: hypothetical protein J7K96_10100 [Desulfobacteraceae bacterium]|nr:hypothetical protein [Desulfobacteraceae bacterium]
MNRIKILMIIIISFGFFASPAIAACILPDADFFYGPTIDNQSEINVSNDTRKNLPSEVDLKKKKSAGFFASSTIAACILPDADFFYGVTIDNQSKTNVSNDTRKNLPSEVDLKGKKVAATLPDDILAPEFFYGYTNLITGGR